MSKKKRKKLKKAQKRYTQYTVHSKADRKQHLQNPLQSEKRRYDCSPALTLSFPLSENCALEQSNQVGLGLGSRD